MRGRGADHIFFSNFTPIIGQADPMHPQSGFFVPRSELGSPNPWVSQPFNPRPSTSTTINSYVVHVGGAQPPGLTKHAVVAVIGVGSAFGIAAYTVTSPAHPPPWAYTTNAPDSTAPIPYPFFGSATGLGQG